jgi:hypothetical protein
MTILSPKEIERRSNIRLSVQKALIGKIPDHLQAVLIDWFEDEIIFYFLYFGEASEADQEDVKSIVQKVEVDFPFNKIQAKFVYVPFGEIFPEIGQDCIFCRKQVRFGSYVISRIKEESGILTYPSPEKLLKDFAGLGRKISEQMVPHVTTYKERIYFAKEIGYVLDKKTGEPVRTSYGIIHYDRHMGAHIVPILEPKYRSLRDSRGIEAEKKLMILLSLQSALLGEIDFHYRAVSVDWLEETIKLYFFFDKEPSEKDEDAAEIIATNMLANFFENSSEIKCIYVPESTAIPCLGQEFVFARKGTHFETKASKDSSERIYAEFPDKEIKRRCDVLLSIQRALLCSISSNVMTVTIGWTEHSIDIYFFYEQEASFDDKKDADSVSKKILKDFPNDKIEVRYVLMSPPLEMKGQKVVFARKEIS